MKNFLKFLPLLLLFVINGCKKPDADQIHFRYVLSYDENTNTTKVSASFYEVNDADKSKNTEDLSIVGMTVKLKKSSSISFNNVELPFDGKFEYSKEIPGLVNGGTFLWKDENGNELVNKVPAPEPVGFPPMTAFNKNFEINFKWTGKPLKGPHEFISFSITDSKSHIQTPVLVTKEPGVINAPVNQTYADGPAVFNLIRDGNSKPEQAGKAGGEIRTIFIAKHFPVNIISDPEQNAPSGHNPE